MDTKLRNSHRLAVLLAIAVLIICSVGMVLAYPVFSREMQDRLDETKVSNDEVIQIAGGLIEGNYILYNEVYEETDRAYVLQKYGGDRFDLLRKYMDYEVFDWDGNALLESNSKSVLENLVKKEDTAYAFRAAFTFQDDGELSDIQVNGNMLDERTEYEIEQYLLDQQVINYEWRGISEPTEVQIVYGVTAENLNSYIDSNELHIDTSVAALISNSMFSGFLFLFAAVLAVTAVLLSVKKSFAFGGEKSIQCTV